LWGRGDVLEDMAPYQGGGEMIHTVSLEGSTYAPVPARFEAGTPAIAQAAGLAEACRYLGGLGMDRVHDHSVRLVDHALHRLDEIPGLTVYGPRHDRAASVTFTLDGVHPHDIASILDHRGIAVRAGHHCAMPIHTRFGIPATARASFYVYNGFDDIDALADGLLHVREVFGLND
jgi:cysteine desulfurase/selenocysteine lyase